MNFYDLPQFLKFLEQKQQLKRISYPVQTHLEITEISKRFLEANGPALLFENVIKQDGASSTIPVLTNLYASIERIAMGLGLNNSTELKELGQLLAMLKQPSPPSSIKSAFSMLPIFKRKFLMK